MAAGLVTGAVAALAFALPAAGDGADAPVFVFEPTPEAPNAQEQGAAAVQHAQKTAKAQQDYAAAARELEDLDRRLPASVHDCNLALAYLRASAITRAQLAWDLSGLRNGARPTWCTGEVSTQLSQALRAAKFVPVAIDVSPSDALVEITGIQLRNMRTVWLPPGQSIVTASAPGKVTKTVTVSVASPTSRVAITLEAPAPEVVADAAVPADAAPDAATAVDAAVAVDLPDIPEKPAPDEGSPFAWRAAALTTAIVGIAGAGLFGYLAYDAKSDANDHYVTDPEFGNLKDKHATYRIATIVAGGFGVAAAGVYVYLATRKPHHVQVSTSPDGTGVGLSYSGSFGGGR